MKTPVLATIAIVGSSLAGAGIAFAVVSNKTDSPPPPDMTSIPVSADQASKEAPTTTAAPVSATPAAAVVMALATQVSIPADQTKYFETHIRPALVQYCYDCHSEETGKTRGGLLLDTREGMLRGGDSGNIMAGDTYKSSIFWEAINWQDFEMPPKDKMPAEIIEKFETWLKMGAPDPRGRAKMVVESKMDIEDGKKHWAYQPPVAAPGASIDSLVAAKLKESSISPVAKAEAGTLLRRINFDLIGLPPTPAEVTKFVSAWKSDSQAAVAAKVDELLKRQQYGERWGRHWLDVARYGESTGKDVNVTYPHIWRYRNYVFDSFNADKPYDEFIREQVAGDLLKVKSEAEWQENLIATGFLAMGTKSLNESNPRQHKMDVADEQIDTLSQSVLGLTISCARCHDHKYDAIPTTDYYALAGIFLSTDTYFGTTPSAQNKRPTKLIELPIADPEVAKKRLTPAQIREMEEQLQDVRMRRREARNDKNSSQQLQAAIRRRVADLESKLAQIGENGIPATMTMGVQDARQTFDTDVLMRGNVEKPAQKVRRGFLQVLPNGGPATIKTGESGRRELANWLSAKDNPLTARVMVNRIWLKLIGEGLVASPNNWGVTGQKPSHPKLLDLLAMQFMDDGWSIKKTIRRIVLSDAYQRSSQMHQANYDRDPDNKLLWRINPRPLDAEALRDSVLAIGGGIDLKRPYGSQVSEAGDNRVGRGFNQDRLSSDVRYRSVYLPILRDDLPDSLGLFDFADPNVTKPKREPTNVPSQALYLMNNPTVLAEAAAMAKDLAKSYVDQDSQIRNAFLRAYGRQPDGADMRAANEFFSRYQPVKQVAASQPRPGPGQFQRRPGQGGRPQGQFRAPRAQGGQGGRPGMAGGRSGGMGRPGGMGGGRTGMGGPPKTVTIPMMTSKEQTLAVFCQSLMASAEFRLLN
ncbi:MAG: PSD1 and planctomycete cytochrome C domain-containing protein [Limisphaerales bacterium]